MLRRILFLSLVAAGCGDNSQAFNFDAGADFAIGPQTTHIGPSSNVCCMQTRGSEFALYLANPSQGATDSDGNEHPAHGELHIADRYGVDVVLAAKAPAGGYTFSPDGQWVMYMDAGMTADKYSLNFAPIEYPDFHMGQAQTAIAQTAGAGLDDLPFFQQGFFSPSGNYFIVGVLPNNVQQSADLHVVNTQTGKDVFDLGHGAFSYLELMAPDDTMVFENSTASTTAGQPSVQGLYVINLAAAQAGATPALIDTHTSQASLLGDGHTLVFLRANRDMVYFDLRDKFFVTLASNVASFTLGPNRRGPFAYVAYDRSVHVLPKLGPEEAVLPPATADVLSPLTFSPDGDHLYYFQHIDSEDQHGILWHLRLNSTDAPVMVGQRVAPSSLNFFQESLIFLDNVSSDGTSGDLFVANLDGTNAHQMATGVANGEVLTAFPVSNLPPPPGKHYGPVDLAPVIVPPVFGNLQNATLDPTKRNAKRLINGGQPIVGALSFGPTLGKPEGVIDPAVHMGTFTFSDDGFVLAYAGGAQWSDAAINYTGKLSLFPTLIDVGIMAPSLDGVSEIGTISARSFFALAPVNSTPGLYFINF